MSLHETMGAFRAGFDHGRDKALEHLDAAISVCMMAKEENRDPNLSVRLSTLRQMRAAISTIRPDIAGGK